MRDAPRRGALLFAIATLALLYGRAPGTQGAVHAPGAHADRVLTVTDSAHVKLLSSDGNTLLEKGKASGTLPGTVEVSLTLGERTATSSFTIHTRGGTISGHGQGKLKAGRAGHDSFGGEVTVVRGSGRFRGAVGTGTLYGSIYRVDDSMSVQVTGKLRY